MENVELQCRCGEVGGRVVNASPGTVNRVRCYCEDCRAYLHVLKRTDLLDAHGGTDIVQVAPAMLSFLRGDDRIVGLRLTSKGLYRWYARCCNTPMGNTVKPGIPFVGIEAHAFGDRAEVFGEARAASFAKRAVGEKPSSRGQIRMMAHAVRLVVGWRLRGKAWPHPFFDRATGKPNHAVRVLTPAERAQEPSA